VEQSVDANGKPVIRPRYTFHALRHFAASLFIEHQGWSPKKIQTVMGHSSIQVTYDIYGKLLDKDPDSDRNAMAQIEAGLMRPVG
jgi:integrase